MRRKDDCMQLERLCGSTAGCIVASCAFAVQAFNALQYIQGGKLDFFIEMRKAATKFWYGAGPCERCA